MLRINTKLKQLHVVARRKLHGNTLISVQPLRKVHIAIISSIERYKIISEVIW